MQNILGFLSLDQGTLLMLVNHAGVLALIAVLFGFAVHLSDAAALGRRLLHPHLAGLICGLVFGAGAVILNQMALTPYPLWLETGALVIGLAGAYLHSPAALLALLIAGVHRASIADGALPGLLLLVLASLLGNFWRLHRRIWEKRSGTTAQRWPWLTSLGITLGASIGTFDFWLAPLPLDASTVLGASLLLGIAATLAGYLLDGTLRLRHREAILRKTSARLNQALAQSKEAASVFHNSRDTIAIMDAQGRVVDANPAYCEAIGCSREELLGMELNHLRVDNDSTDAFRQRVGMAVRKHGHWRGEMVRRRLNGDLFVSDVTIECLFDESGEVRRWITIGRDLTEKHRLEAELARAGHYDSLTGLPNRLLMTQHLEQLLIDHPHSVTAVCVLDLDDFKTINDKHGNPSGDECLRTIAKALQAQAPAGTRLGRLGGDEFVAVIGPCDDNEDALSRCEQVRQALQNCELPLTPAHLRLRCSGGVTLYPTDDADPDGLLRHADLAMVTAKQHGRDRLCVFDSGEDRQTQARHESIKRIEQAISGGEMVLHFQPKVRLSDGQVVGAEALVRWQHPQRGLLSPAAFLDQILGTPVARLLDHWVLAEALRHSHAWWQEGCGLQVSVNLSVPSLIEPDFLQRVQDQLDRFPDLPRGSLELELLETETLGDLSMVGYLIEQLAQRGVECAIDDFGTGYSSLSYLQKLPAHTIKIDRSFVQDMLNSEADRTLVRGIISLAQAFERKIVAEGVESDAHAAALRDMGCDVLQGYGIARPMAAQHIPSWARTWRLPHLLKHSTAQAMPLVREAAPESGS